MEDRKPKDQPEHPDTIQPANEPTGPGDGEDDDQGEDDTTPGNVPSPGKTTP